MKLLFDCTRLARDFVKFGMLSLMLSTWLFASLVVGILIASLLPEMNFWFTFALCLPVFPAFGVWMAWRKKLSERVYPFFKEIVDPPVFWLLGGLMLILPLWSAIGIAILWIMQEPIEPIEPQIQNLIVDLAIVGLLCFSLERAWTQWFLPLMQFLKENE